MKLFSHTSKLCLLALLLMFIYGISGQGDNQRSIFKRRLQERQGEEKYFNYAATCGIRPLENMSSMNLFHLQRSPADIAESNSAAGDLNVSVGKYSGERIVGGNIARYGEFPWQGRIQFNDQSYTAHACGAVIISEYWLLTAAHCVRNVQQSHFQIHVGDIDNIHLEKGEQIFHIENISVHERYEAGEFDCDIALIKIQSDNNGRGIQFTDNVQPVCLPNPGTQLETGSMCIVSGWGSIAQRQPGTDIYSYPVLLEGVEVPLIDQQLCKAIYGSNLITDNMICAGSMDGGKSTCQGDSGGPLVCKVGDVYTLCGIVSGASGCAWPNLPTYYTRVTSFLSWIADVTRA